MQLKSHKVLINAYYPEIYRDFFGIFGIYSYLCKRQLVKTERRITEGLRFIPFQVTQHCKDTGFSWFLQIFLVNMSKNNKV